MYVRPQSYRYSGEVRLPENYSGSTFREPPLIEPDVEEEKAAPSEPEQDTRSASPNASETAAKLHLDTLFGGKGKIGTEELLILALVLLLSDGENNNDLVLFLMLLLFIK